MTQLDFFDIPDVDSDADMDCSTCVFNRKKWPSCNGAENPNSYIWKIQYCVKDKFARLERLGLVNIKNYLFSRRDKSVQLDVK